MKDLSRSPRRRYAQRSIPLTIPPNARPKDPRSACPHFEARPGADLERLRYSRHNPLSSLLQEARSLSRTAAPQQRRPAARNFLFISNLNDNVTEPFLLRKVPHDLPVRRVQIPEHNARRVGLASLLLPPSADPAAYVARLNGSPFCGQPLVVVPDPHQRLFRAAWTRATRPPPQPSSSYQPRLAKPGQAAPTSRSPSPPPSPSSHPAKRRRRFPPRVIYGPRAYGGNSAPATYQAPRYPGRQPALLVCNVPSSVQGSRLLDHFFPYKPEDAVRHVPSEWVITFRREAHRDEALNRGSCLLGAASLALSPVSYEPRSETQSTYSVASDRPGVDLSYQRARTTGSNSDCRSVDAPERANGALTTNCQSFGSDSKSRKRSRDVAGVSTASPGDQLAAHRNEGEVHTVLPVDPKPNGTMKCAISEAKPPSNSAIQKSKDLGSQTAGLSDAQVSEAAFLIAKEVIFGQMSARRLVRHRGSFTRRFESSVRKLESAKSAERHRVSVRETQKAVNSSEEPASSSDARDRVQVTLKTDPKHRREREKSESRKRSLPAVTLAHNDLDAYLNGTQEKRRRVDPSRRGTQAPKVSTEKTTGSSGPQDAPPRKAEKSHTCDGGARKRLRSSRPQEAEIVTNEAHGKDVSLSQSQEVRPPGERPAIGKEKDPTGITAQAHATGEAGRESESDDHVAVPSPGTIGQGEARRRRITRVDISSQESGHVRQAKREGKRDQGQNVKPSTVRGLNGATKTKRKKLTVPPQPREVQVDPPSSNTSDATGELRGTENEPEKIPSAAENENDGDDGEDASAPDTEEGCARTAGLRLNEWRRAKCMKSQRKYIQQNVDVLYTSRDNRQRNRVFRKGISLINPKHDILSVNQLKQRKKAVQYRKSSIHGMGLYACETIEPGEFIIEYIGEIVRSVVADIREESYSRSGCGDSYLFRLPNGKVVDATHRGCIARFINHSCDPNIIAKTISVDGEAKIVFYSKKRINVDEELTYDYKFDFEEEEKKIKCLCTANNCRKFLN